LEKALTGFPRREGKRGHTCYRCKEGKPPLKPVPDGFKVATIGSALDKEGNLEKQWVGAKPESEHFAEVQPAIPQGHGLKGISTLVDGEGNVRAQWIKTNVEQQKQAELVIDAIKGLFDAQPEAPRIPPPEEVSHRQLCIYPMGDPHFGMYAWAAECGDDYDLGLAEQYHVAAMQALVDSAPPAEEALIINLGDFFHMDTSSNMTPKSGHILDVDTRRPKVARAGVRALRRLVDIVLTKHRRARLWCVRGNHDPDSTTMLQLALAMFYAHEPRVVVDESPAIALYHRFGRNLIGATHTHTARDLMLLGEVMATHRKEDWGVTDHRYFYCGHVHHDSLTETRGGVIVETMRTLAAQDKYAADNFYNAGRDMKCDVLDLEDGRITRNTIGIRQIKRLLGKNQAPSGVVAP
jgi:hypothetical protein